ncbi:MAG TPA: ATP-binding protein [Phycisphaeraceae bacterium]
MPPEPPGQDWTKEQLIQEIKQLRAELARYESQQPASPAATPQPAQEAQARQQQLEEQLRLIRSAVDQIDEAVVITEVQLDPPGPRIIYVNPGFERMTGYQAHEVIGRTPRILQGPRTSRAVLDRLRKQLEQGLPFHGQTVNYRKDGSEFILDWDITPLRNAQGRITHWVSIQRDVTAQKAAEELARRHEEELAHIGRLSTMGEMASGLAHELNQPLAAITNYIQGCLRRLQSGPIPPGDLEQIMTRIAAQAERASQIIRRLRNFVRKRQTRRSSTRVNDLVMDAIALIEPQVRQQNIQLRLELGADLPLVLLDSIQVEQVILNLVRNAIEAMEDNAPQDRMLTIQTVRESPALVRVSVRDRGQGVAQGAYNRIFDPFFTTKPRGMGMGLTISQSIVQAHHGRLWAQRNEDRGMTFHFTLPVSPPTS